MDQQPTQQTANLYVIAWDEVDLPGASCARLGAGSAYAGRPRGPVSRTDSTGPPPACCRNLASAFDEEGDEEN
jgi:hypothetical protein